MQFLAGLVTKREENVHPYKVQYEAGLPQDGIVGYLSPSDPINPTTWSSETPDGHFHTMPGAWIWMCVTRDFEGLTKAVSSLFDHAFGLAHGDGPQRFSLMSVGSKMLKRQNQSPTSSWYSTHTVRFLPVGPIDPGFEAWCHSIRSKYAFLVPDGSLSACSNPSFTSVFTGGFALADKDKAREVLVHREKEAVKLSYAMQSKSATGSAPLLPSEPASPSAPEGMSLAAAVQAGNAEQIVVDSSPSLSDVAGGPKDQQAQASPSAPQGMSLAAAFKAGNAQQIVVDASPSPNGKYLRWDISGSIWAQTMLEDRQGICCSISESRAACNVVCTHGPRQTSCGCEEVYYYNEAFFVQDQFDVQQHQCQQSNEQRSVCVCLSASVTLYFSLSLSLSLSRSLPLCLCLASCLSGYLFVCLGLCV